MVREGGVTGLLPGRKGRGVRCHEQLKLHQTPRLDMLLKLFHVLHELLLIVVCTRVGDVVEQIEPREVLLVRL